METQINTLTKLQLKAFINNLKLKKLLIIFSIIILVFIIIVTFILLTKKDDTQNVDKTNLEEIFNSFDAENPVTFNRAEELIDLGKDQIPALLKKLKEKDIYTKWASLYALSRLGYDSDQETKNQIINGVKAEINNEAESIKIMSAGILVIFGDKEGIPILIEGLKTKEQLLLTEPPLLICQYSKDTLEYYLQETFGNECNWEEVDQNTYDEWNKWWQENNTYLVWNDEKNIYETAK